MSEPQSGTPEFDGKCAFGVGLAGADKAPAAKPAYTLVKDGKTYAFNGAVPRFLFKIIPGSAERAQRKWAAGRG